MPDGDRTVRVALAGNPNCGKTSLFNALTGARQHVGNYAGVTVEKRTGRYERGGRRYEVVDLPGTYSLTAWSPEERIAQDSLRSGEHDVVVVVADSTNLKRGLVLLAQVLEAGSNVALALNMADEAAAAGQRLDLPELRRRLGIPVVETVGHRRRGVDALRRAIDDAATSGPPAARVDLGGVGEPSADEDEALHLATAYARVVDRLLDGVVEQAARPDARALSDRIDRLLVDRVAGLPIFAAVMYGVFWLTFTLGEVPMGWLEAGFDWLAGLVDGLWPAGYDSPLRSLLVDGVIGGVGGVIVFLPNILLLFAGLALLEDSGYMARAAFLMDRVMHRFGLHGRSFLPLMTGFGCSVPGIMATRTLEHDRDRLTTMLVLPLMSCGARLPIWLLLIPAFFPSAWRAPVLWAIYATGIGVALLLAFVLRRSLLRGADAPFVMELPPYRLPALSGVGAKMVERGWLYLRKAGTVILAISVLMWLATSYPKPSAYQVDAEVAAGATLPEGELSRRRAAEDLHASAAGYVGRALEPALRPLGFDWRIATALVGAFAAKEVFVAQMGIVYAKGEVDETSDGLRAALRRDYSPAVGLSLVLFLLIATPCMATLAITRRESGSWRWAFLQLGGLTAVAWTVSLVVYQVGRVFV